MAEAQLEVPSIAHCMPDYPERLNRKTVGGNPATPASGIADSHPASPDGAGYRVYSNSNLKNGQ
jgi:hypothetical protein